MVSIVIPCFNNGRLLKEMVDCIINQTCKDWELIIIDDGSTDDTFEFISNYKKDNRISVIHRDRAPKGGDTCRNIGLEKANGEYIIFFDADDLISDSCLETRVKLMEECPDFDYISFPAKTFTDSKNLPDYYTKGKTLGIGTEKNVLKNLLQANYSFAVWCNIYRTKALKENKIEWDEKVYVYQDFDFMFSCINSNLKHKFSNTKELDYFYRIVPGSVSSNFVSDVKCTSTIYLFRKILDVICNQKKNKTLLEYFKKFIFLHFKRLCKDGDCNKMRGYLDMISIYYDNKYVLHLTKIYNKYRNINNEVLRYIYFLSIERNYIQIFKLLIKKIIRK